MVRPFGNSATQAYCDDSLRKATAPPPKSSYAVLVDGGREGWSMPFESFDLSAVEAEARELMAIKADRRVLVAKIIGRSALVLKMDAEP